MSSVSGLLRLLSQNQGEFVSGEDIARELGVSRAAVSKACRVLRKSGYEIESRTNKGYMLSADADVLSKDLIESSAGVPCDIQVYDEVGSTNDVAKEVVLKAANAGESMSANTNGEPETTYSHAYTKAIPFVAIADKQTAGRGRLGRSFESPAGTGLYMSFAFRPEYDIEKSLFVTMAAAVGTCRAIERVVENANADHNAAKPKQEPGSKHKPEPQNKISESQDAETDATKYGSQTPAPQIKWVNDIFMNGKKVCGILTEAQSDFESGHIDRLVVGIGINCFPGSFPPEIKDIAGTVANHKGAFSRSMLATAMIDEVLPLVIDPDINAFLPEYRRRCFILGQKIVVHRTYDDVGIPAKALEITDDGGLVVEYLYGADDHAKGTSRNSYSKNRLPGDSNPARTTNKMPGEKEILRTGEISISL